MFCRGGKKRLSQVLINLLTNAIKFTTKGSIRLGYEIHGKMLYFYVADTGCGFPESQKQKVFERFVRLDSAKPGTGLGLAICRTIVEKMGGMYRGRIRRRKRILLLVYHSLYSSLYRKK